MPCSCCFSGRGTAFQRGQHVPRKAEFVSPARGEHGHALLGKGRTLQKVSHVLMFVVVTRGGGHDGGSRVAAAVVGAVVVDVVVG